MNKLTKVGCDLINGVFLVDDFESYDGERKIFKDEEHFYDELRVQNLDDVTFYCELSFEMLKKINNEYGVSEVPGGPSIELED